MQDAVREIYFDDDSQTVTLNDWVFENTFTDTFAIKQHADRIKNFAFADKVGKLNNCNLSIKSGSTNAHSQIEPKNYHHVQDEPEKVSKDQHMEMLRKKREELLQIQLSVQQSLLEIHSKLKEHGDRDSSSPVKVSKRLKNLKSKHMSKIKNLLVNCR